MAFIALGINHKTAPVELREKVAFSPDTLMQALQACPQQTQVQELVILSTCNRTEIYAQAHDDKDGNIAQKIHAVKQWLSEFHNISPAQIEQHSYLKQDDDAVDHLMQVACGLDSLIVGEPQILGQVKQAFAEAKNAGQVKTRFEKLFQSTFSVAKKVRTETEIGANAVSVAFAAVQLAKQIFSSLHNSNVLLIGAGETIELVAKHLQEANAGKITVANRTLSRAQSLADELHGQAITISQIPSHLGQSDIVISSTASSLPLISLGMVEKAIKTRKHKPILMIDLAVPRDIESEVADIDEAYLYTVDDLQNIVEQNVANRELAADQAKTMIAEQVAGFAQWQAQHQQVDLIKVYRERAEQLRDQHLQRAMKQLDEGKDSHAVLQEMAFKLTQSMLHGPTKALHQASKEAHQNNIDLLVEAFDLTPSKQK